MLYVQIMVRMHDPWRPSAEDLEAMTSQTLNWMNGKHVIDLFVDYIRLLDAVTNTVRTETPPPPALAQSRFHGSLLVIW